MKTLTEMIQEANELAPQTDKGYHAEAAGPVANLYFCSDTQTTMNGKGYRFYLRQQAQRKEA